MPRASSEMYAIKQWMALRLPKNNNKKVEAEVTG